MSSPATATEAGSAERRESGAPSPRSCVCGVGKPQAGVARDADLKGVIAGNREWVASVNEHNPTFFEKLGQGQAPEYLYIGCSDARVEPTRLLGLSQGELFVHRNVGNCCPNDLNFLSVLEYAVNFLKVPHIIVCGHYDCGAVRNSGKVQDIGLLENWIRQIRDVARLHDDELQALEEDSEAKHRRLVELNVVEQARNVLKTACVQRRRHETRDRDASAAEADGGYAFATPQVHAFVFDPADGLVKKLDEEVHAFEHIYNLYK